MKLWKAEPLSKRKLGFFVLLVALLTTVAVLSGCGGTPASAAPPAQPPAQPPPANPAPTVVLTATPAAINAGEFSTLQWTTTNATSITITPSVLKEDQSQLAMNDRAPVTPSATTTYVATVTGPGGTATASVTVTVNQLAPSLTFSAQPASILSGQPASLAWSSTHATSISIDHGIGVVQPVESGTKQVNPTGTTTYTATATGPGGTTTVAATVTVAAQLAVTLTATPTSVAAGAKSTLHWESQGASGVSIDNGIGTVGLTGDLQVSPTQATTYTATATDASGNKATASATVTVLTGGDLNSKIKHIIFMLQENRSFDNYFSNLNQYRVAKGLPADVEVMDKNKVLFDVNNAGVSPYHFRTVCHENVSPAWNESHHAYNGGLMDFFMKSPSIPSTIDPGYHRAMGYYTEAELPYYYELATQFAISDHFFSSLMANTNPNRMYMFAATSFGHIFPAAAPPGGWPVKTIFEALQEKGVSWRYYYLDNSIFLAEWKAWEDPAITSNVRPISEYYRLLADPNADTVLPSVIFIERASQTELDEHPGNNLQTGAAVVRQIIDSLMKSTAWQSSVFIYTFDEAGGMYDHVAPFSVPNPDGIAPQRGPNDLGADDNFTLSGFRLPFIMVSPWVRPHFVSKKPRELTSILRLIEKRFGLDPLTARDAWADDMAEFFDFSNPAWLTPPPLPDQPTDGVCDYQLETSP